MSSTVFTPDHLHSNSTTQFKKKIPFTLSVWNPWYCTPLTRKVYRITTYKTLSCFVVFCFSQKEVQEKVEAMCHLLPIGVSSLVSYMYLYMYMYSTVLYVHMYMYCTVCTHVHVLYCMYTCTCTVLYYTDVHVLYCMYTCTCTVLYVHMYMYRRLTVSTDLSNLVPSAIGLINSVETFTSVYNLYLYNYKLYILYIYIYNYNIYNYIFII